MVSKLLKLGLVLLLSGALGLPVFGQGKIAVPKEMALIPAGAYTPFFSAQEGKKKVKGFLLDVNPVTNAEFLRFVKANPQWAKSRIPKIYGSKEYLKHWEGDFNIGKNAGKLNNSPVTNISWFAARAYAKWKGKRLPSSDEWEYVAGAPLLNDKRPIEKVILEWYSKPNPAIFPAVGSTFKNRYQVYDMHGLVWEWVYDFNSVMMEGDSRSNDAINRSLFCASGSAGAANKEDYAAFMRFAFRGSLKAAYTLNNLGFRCAADIN